MIQSAFKIDGIAYNVIVPDGGLNRTGSVLDGKNAGRTSDGSMVRDIIGTYYNYQLQLETKGLDVITYDRLYDVLTTPQDYHLIEMPYGQETLVFKAYISNAKDNLIQSRRGKNLWGKLSVDFVAMQPQRRP